MHIASAGCVEAQHFQRLVFCMVFIWLDNYLFWWRFNHSRSIVSCSLSEFFSELFDIIRSLLSEYHNLESIKIGGFFSLVESNHLLTGFSGGPLGIEIVSLGSLKKCAGSASSEDWHSKSGKSKSLQWVDGSWEVRSVNKHANEVDEVHNDDHFAVIFSVIDEANSSWFNKISKTLHEQNV